MGELKILAIEARNHLYAVLKDTEIWQEALQSWSSPFMEQLHIADGSSGWRESRLAKEARRASRDQAMMEEEGNLSRPFSATPS